MRSGYRCNKMYIWLISLGLFGDVSLLHKVQTSVFQYRLAYIHVKSAAKRYLIPWLLFTTLFNIFLHEGFPFSIVSKAWSNSVVIQTRPRIQTGQIEPKRRKKSLAKWKPFTCRNNARKKYKGKYCEVVSFVVIIFYTCSAF